MSKKIKALYFCMVICIIAIILCFIQLLVLEGIITIKNGKQEQIKKETITVNRDEYYSSIEQGYITTAKHQGSTSLCWVYAAIGAMEANILKNNPELNTVDLSEYQMAYYIGNGIKDTSGTELVGLSENCKYNFVNIPGNQNYVINALNKGLRLIDEKPIDNIMFRISKYIDNTYAFKGSYELKKYHKFYNMDKDLLKKAVKEYGALATSFNYEKKYYDKNNYSYNQNVTDETNHAVLLIGWDDNYPKEKFKIHPKNDGAWLIKNSWGTDWGDNGCFWLSYEDTSFIYSNSYAYEVNISK